VVLAEIASDILITTSSMVVVYCRAIPFSRPCNRSSKASEWYHAATGWIPDFLEETAIILVILHQIGCYRMKERSFVFFQPWQLGKVINLGRFGAGMRERAWSKSSRSKTVVLQLLEHLKEPSDEPSDDTPDKQSNAPRAKESLPTCPCMYPFLSLSFLIRH
jgi:hypothetical protein